MATKSSEDYEVTISLPDHFASEIVPEDVRGTLKVKLTYKPTKGSRSVDLKEGRNKILTLSIVGDVWNRKGYIASCQCVSTIREIWGHIPEVSELCDLWERWHLNDIIAGTRPQTAALATEARPDDANYYDWACELLKRKGLFIDRGYEFAKSWLFDPMPAKVVARIRTLVKKIDFRA